MVFKLFKHIGLDLIEGFEPGALIVQHVVLLTEDFDGAFPHDANPVVHSSQNLKMFLNYHYSGSWKDMFEGLWNFKRSPDKDLVLYLNAQDFCTLVVKYLKEIYPAISDENLKKLYYLTCDRIGTTYGYFYNTSKQAAMAYRTLATNEMVLDLTIKNTQCEGIFTDEMRAALPFELHYADHLLNGKASRFHAQYVSVLKEQTLNEFRRHIILEIKDALLYRLTAFYNYFPGVERKATLMETLQDKQFDFLNDLAITQHDGTNRDEDGNDVKYVIQRYGTEYLKETLKQVKPYQGTDKWIVAAHHLLIDVLVDERAKIIESGEYENLLDNPKISWLQNAGLEMANRLRYNLLLIEFFRSMSKAELAQFDLTAAGSIQAFGWEDLEIVGAISS
jgi:hypothetical protein